MRNLSGHVLMENRHELYMDLPRAPATGQLNGRPPCGCGRRRPDLVFVPRRGDTSPHSRATPAGARNSA